MDVTSDTPSPLLIPELFYHILDILADSPHEDNDWDDWGVRVQPPDPDAQQALAALAQTCQAFKEPALNLLWKKMNSLRPLLRLYHSSTELCSTRRYSWRAPTPADWDVMDQYLHRVEELEVRDDILASFFLKSVFCERQVFPNLRVLVWNREYGSIKWIKPLLSSSLVTLDASSYEGDEKAIASLFKTCRSYCPNLTTLKFVCDSIHDEEFRGPLSQTLCDFQNLKCVAVCPMVDGDALEHLILSPKLEELIIATHRDQILGLSLPPSSIPFCNLKNLELWIFELYPFTELLRPGAQKFREVTLHLRTLELPSAIELFFSGLGTRVGKNPLTLLRIDSQDFDVREDIPRYVLSSNHLRPLTFLGNLRELSIQLENPISVSDEELVELVRSWPLLRTFDLCCIRRSPAKWITLKGLVLLMAARPELRHVSLTLDAREIPTEINVPAGSQFKSLTALSFPNSPINNPENVARFLMTYFPALTSNGRSENHYRWRQAMADDRYLDAWQDVWAHMDGNDDDMVSES